ncbi:MAG: NAD(P)H-dependent oxidoreductase [Candidatus Dojkabacteria bacterium]|nr:NAD(P)H-dependent oxidoreductase [Candidatus Dojkabacteria bacterium]
MKYLFNKNLIIISKINNIVMLCSIFVGSLKKNIKDSNTYRTALLVKKEFAKYEVETKLYYLRNFRIAPGVEFDTGEKWDEFKQFYEVVNSSDILMLATPIWWGIHSSLCQSFMERIGAYDDLAIKTGFTPLYNKVFGCIITASNDGFQHVHGIFNSFASNMGMTCPPENHVYWGTKVSFSKSSEDPRKNKETMNQIKNCVRNLYLWSKVIKKLDLGTKAQNINPGRVGLLSDDTEFES